MRTVTLFEYDRLYAFDDGEAPRGRTGLPRRVFEQLRAFDLRCAERTHDTIFDWSGRASAKARNWVGVVSFGEASVEILPKIDRGLGSASAHEARTNVVQMLRYAGALKVRARDTAMLAADRAPMSELLLHLFAERVRSELTAGLVRAYRAEADDLRVVRGRIDVRRYAHLHVRRPGWMPCRFDEHTVDTPLMRLIRATCAHVRRATRSARTRSALEQAVELLADVRAVPLDADLAAAVEPDRRLARFDDIVAFCKLVAGGLQPDVRHGDHRAFALLFPMESLFERFADGFFRREVLRHRPQIALQSQGRALDTHLVRDRHTARGVGRLEPDLCFTWSGVPSVRVVVDLKWKRPDKRPSRDVLYQSFAYGACFDAPVVVLLYPARPGWADRDFDFQTHRGRLLLRAVDVSRPLDTPGARQALAEEWVALLDDWHRQAVEVHGERYGMGGDGMAIGERVEA